MKAIAAVIVMFATLAICGQATPPSTPKPPDVVVAKETVDSLKLQLALETLQKIGTQAQVVQSSIEPQLAPLRQQYGQQNQVIDAQIDVVKRENGWGPEVTYDRNLQSPTFGKFVRSAPTAPQQAPPRPPMTSDRPPAPPAKQD